MTEEGEWVESCRVKRGEGEKMRMKQEDLEMDEAADITRGCVDPAVNLCVSVGQVGTLLSVLTLIKSCRYWEWVTEGLEEISS